MNIFEEYYSRHNLNCPLIRRTDSQIIVVCKADVRRWKRNWLIFQITKRVEPHNPAYYSFSWLLPTHNSLNGARTSLSNISSGNLMTRLSEDVKVEWDDYETEILKVSMRDDGIYPLRNLDEARICMWEMFLYGYDDFIASMPSGLRWDIYSTLDDKLDKDKRLSMIADISKIWQRMYPQVNNKWDHFQSFYCQESYYGSWFADLVKAMSDESYRKEYSDLISII